MRDRVTPGKSPKCSCADKRNCQHPWRVQIVRRSCFTTPTNPTGKIVVSLEKFAAWMTGADMVIRGRGSEKVAQQWADTVRLAIDTEGGKRFRDYLASTNSPMFPAGGLTVRQLYDRYKSEYVEVSGLHWKRYTEVPFKHLIEEFGDRPAASLTLAEMEFLWKPWRKLASGTQKQYANRLWGMFHWASHPGRSQATGLSRPPCSKEDLGLDKLAPPNVRQRRLREGEEEKLWAAAKEFPKLSAAMTLSISTGLRIGSLRRLQMKHVDAAQGLHGSLLLPSTAMKGRRPSTKGLTETSRRAIDERIAFYTQRGNLTPDTFLFGTNEGMEIPGGQFLRNEWDTTRARCGMTEGWTNEALHFHDLRAEAASRLLKEKQDLKMASYFLDHKNVSTTERYLRIESEEKMQRDIVEAMNSIESRKPTPKPYLLRLVDKTSA